MTKVHFIANGKRVSFDVRNPSSTPDRELTPFARYVKRNGAAANKKASSPSAAIRALAKAWKKKK